MGLDQAGYGGSDTRYQNTSTNRSAPPAPSTPELLAPPAYTSDIYSNMAGQLGLADAQYNFGRNYANRQFGLTQQEQTAQNQGIGLDRGDIYSNYYNQQGQFGNELARQNIDIGLGNQTINSLQTDIGRANENIGSYGQDRGTMAQQLASQLAGFQNRADEAGRQNLIEATGQGSYFGQNRMANNRNIADELAQQSTEANLSSELQQRDLDRAVRSQQQNIESINRNIYGEQAGIDKAQTRISDVELSKTLTTDNFNSALQRNGLQAQLGNISMDQLKSEFQNRIDQLGLQSQLDVNRIFSDAMSESGKRGQGAMQMLQQLLPEIISNRG